MYEPEVDLLCHFYCWLPVPDVYGLVECLFGDKSGTGSANRHTDILNFSIRHVCEYVYGEYIICDIYVISTNIAHFMIAVPLADLSDAFYHFSHLYRASYYYQSFYYQLTHKRITLKGILTFTLNQLQHVSVWSPSSGSVLCEFAKVTAVKHFG